MNKPDSNDWFSADRPISHRVEDKLARRAFADAIAAALRGWRGRDSLIIALHGAWGTGKSSIKNMAVEGLSEERDQRVAVAEFNPWQVGNRDQLTEVFFDQIGMALGRSTEGSREQQRRVLNKWRRYAAYLIGGHNLLRVVRKPLVAILVGAAVLLFGAAAVNLRVYGFLFGIVVLVIGALIGWSSRVAGAVVRVLEVGVDVGRKSIDEVKDELAEELKKLGFPLLVVIDDVDRLTPQETLEVFQLIKANGDLPNIVYLVLFERGAIERNIEEVLKVSGREYLEKIVQVGFDVPVIDRMRLKRVLFEGLDRALAIEGLGERFDKRRWSNLFVGALDPYFATLRQVNRFLSTIAFHVSLLRATGTLEVNVVDLVGLEVLRTFEPEVYRGLPACKEVLTSMRERNGQDQEQRRIIHSLVERAPAEHQDRVRDIIKQLFPPAEWAFGGSRYTGNAKDRWHRELRICVPEIFDRYFSFAIPEGDVSQAVIERLRGLVGDRGGLRQELRSLREQGLLDVVLDRFEAYKEELPLEHAEPFVTAMFDIGEDVSDDRPGMFEISPAMHASRIIYWFLRREPRSEERARILESAIKATEGLSLPVRFVTLEEPSPDRERADDRLLTDEALAAMKQLCVQKLSAAAASGKLAEANSLAMIVYRWREWAGPEGPAAFCRELVRTVKGAVRLTETFLHRSWSHTMGDYVGREHRYITLGELEIFVPWEQVNSALVGLDETTLAEEQRAAVTAFRRAVQHRQEGKPDYGVGRGRDDDE
jgi:predicted KAP-like P-loop ATPase